VEGSNHGLIEGTILAFTGQGLKEYDKFHSQQTASQSRFEHGNSRVQITGVAILAVILTRRNTSNKTLF
jgi:hypothetical protein